MSLRLVLAIKHKVLLWLIAVVLFLGAAPLNQAQGNVRNERPRVDTLGCKPIDLIMIVDQSSSMLTADRFNRRIDAMRSIVDRMYLDTAVRCPKITHQLAVIGFGDTVEVLVRFTPISVPDIRANWQGEAEALKARIRPNDLGQTRILLAFEEARRLFDEGGRDDSVQSIIFLSDGMPCTSIASNKGDCGNPDWVRHYLFGDRSTFYPASRFSENGFESAKSFIERMNELFPIGNASFAINVMVFSILERFPSLDEAWTLVTGTRNGSYIPPESLKSGTALTSTLNDFMNGLLGVDVNEILCDEPFYLEPYVSNTTIISSIRPDANERVTLIDPNGNVVTPSSGVRGNSLIDYLQLQTVERYVITNPIPGAWRLKASRELCRQISANYETVKILAEFVKMPEKVEVQVSSPYYTNDSRDFVEIRVKDASGALFRPLPDYPLFVCATVTGPSSATSALREQSCIPFTEQLNSVWRSDTPLPAPRQGTYTMTLTATVPSVRPDAIAPIQVFEYVRTYETLPPVDVVLEIVSPTTNQVLPLNTLDNVTRTNLPFDVAVQIRASASQLLQPITRVFPENVIADSVIAVLKDELGQEVERITLTPRVGDDFLLQGTMRAGVKELDPAGKYTVSVKLSSIGVNNYNTENYAFTETASVSSRTFERRELRGVKLVPVDVPEKMPLNVIVSGSSQSVPIAVKARLLDQSGNLVPIADVFVQQDKRNIVWAVLLDSAGKIVEERALEIDPSDSSLFIGTLRNNPNLIDAPGVYTLRLQIGKDASRPAIDETRFAFMSPETDSATITRIQRFGVNVVILDPQENAVMRLNEFVGENLVPNHLPVRVLLLDLDGNRVTDIAEKAQRSLVNAVFASLRDANGQEVERIGLTLNSSDAFVGEMRKGVTELDPEGTYQLMVEADPNLFEAGEVTKYEWVNHTAVVTFERLEVLGVRLSVARVNNASPQQQPLQIPIYANAFEAFFDTPSVVNVFFELQNHIGESLFWQRLVGQETAFKPDDILNAVIHSEDRNISVPLQDIQAVEEDGRFLLRAQLPMSELPAGNYELFFKLQAANLLSNVSNLSNDSAVSLQLLVLGGLLNPLFWNSLRGIAWLIVAVLAVNFLWINAGPYRMQGTLSVQFHPSSEGDSGPIRLATIKILRRRVKKSYTVSTSRGLVRITVVVTSGKCATGDASESGGVFDNEDQPKQSNLCYFVQLKSRLIKPKGDDKVGYYDNADSEEYIELPQGGEETRANFTVKHVS